MIDNDWVLMQRVARGDRLAISELYDRFGSLVYRMAYQLMPTQADAEDAVQEIYIRLWQSAGRYDPDRASLATWVILISRRHLVDQLRRMRVRPKLAGMDENAAAGESSEDGPEVGLLTDERQERLRQRIATLPELQRQVIELAYLGGKTLREIGVELDKPIGTIKSALSRALAGLRERVSSEESIL